MPMPPSYWVSNNGASMLPKSGTEKTTVLGYNNNEFNEAKFLHSMLFHLASIFNKPKRKLLILNIAMIMIKNHDAWLLET